MWSLCILIDFGISFQFYCVSLYIILIMEDTTGHFTRNTNMGYSEEAFDFGDPPKTPCKLTKGTYEIRTSENSDGYLFQITPIQPNIGIYSINDPDLSRLGNTYMDTQVGTVHVLSDLILTDKHHIINGPGIDVGGMLIHIERFGESTFYKLICDKSPANGGRGRGSRCGSRRGRSRHRGSRRGRSRHRGSRRGRGRSRRTRKN